MADPTQGSVVVVGGGYAGASVAKRLDRHATVTLVEPRDAFAHNIASLRALVHPEWAPNLFLPYDGLLRHGTVVRDRAVRVDRGRVELWSGEVLEPDVVVLATGSRYPFPAKPAVDASDDALAALAGAHAELARAGRVLLVGAGAVGIELAAEIKLAWPATAVVLLDEAPDLLGATAHSERLRAELRGRLQVLGVELRLGTSLRSLPEVPPARCEPFTVETGTGERLAADLWFRCFGVEPASEVLGPSLAGARRADGSVEVDGLLRVGGRSDVFALGDVSTADVKMAGVALLQAPVVAANVKARLRGETPSAIYQPLGPMIMVAIGEDDGAGESPAGFHLGAEVADLKGRDLLVAFFRELFGVEALPTIP